MCECPTGRKCYCEAMTAYAHNCRRLGVSLPDWRTMTGCHTYWPASSHPSRAVDSACLLLLVIVFLHLQLCGSRRAFTWPTRRNGQYIYIYILYTIKCVVYLINVMILLQLLLLLLLLLCAMTSWEISRNGVHSQLTKIIYSNLVMTWLILKGHNMVEVNNKLI
jgi:hypothetical protein